MASKKQTVTLQLDLDLPRGKIKEFGEMLNNSTKLKMDTGKGKDFLSEINSTIKNTTTEAGKLLKLFNKPIKNAESAKHLGDALEDSLKGLEGKLFSLQGMFARTFNSKENQKIIEDYKKLSSIIEKMEKDYKKVAELNAKKNDIGTNANITKEMSLAKKELKELEKDKAHWGKVEKARYKELNKIIEEGNEKLREKGKITKTIETIHKKQGVSGQGALSAKIKEAQDNKSQISGGMFTETDLATLNSLLTDYRNNLKMATDSVEDLGDRSQSSWDQINESQMLAAKKMKTFKEVLQGLGLGFSISELARGFKQLARYSFDFYKQLDKSLTNISIVTRMTREEVQSLTTDFISMAKQTGMSIDDIAQGAVIFFQQGLSNEEALKMTEIAAEFAKVADISVESASDKLTAAVNGYNMAVSDAADVADKLNVLAAESAASIDELATAMEKGASMASQSGLSFDQYNAILATMIEVTREAPENIGTSMKTIMARFQQIKKAGTTEDGDTDVNAVETALKSVGVQLRDADGILRELGDVLDDLGPKWNSLDRNTQAYLGTIIAGTRQQSRFISLMQNWDRALELTTASEQSAGAQALQHQLAMDGLEASINNLTIAWQNFLTKLTSSDMFKGALDTLTAIMNIITSFKDILPALGLTYGIIKLNKHLKLVKETLKNDPNAKTSFLYQLNEMLINMRSSGSKFTKFVLGAKTGLKAMALAWKQNTIECTNFFVKVKLGSAAMVKTLIPKMLTGVKVLKNGIIKAVAQISASLKTMAATSPLAIISLIATAVTLIGGLIDKAIFDGEEKLEKANKRMKENMDKFEIASGKENIIEANLKTYESLSKAISLTVSEQEKLNNATKELAENVKEAVIGYDAMGNAILDINKVKEAKDKAGKTKVEASRNVIGDIGNTMAADFEARGEQNWKDKKYSFSTVGTGIGGLAAGAGIGAIIGALGGPIGIAAGAAIGGAIGLVSGAIANAVGAKKEEDRLARKEFLKVLGEHEDEMIKAIDTLTNAFISFDKDVYDKGGRLAATKEEKEAVANRMQSQFLRDKTQEVGDKVISGDIDADEAAKELDKISDAWEYTIASIGDQGMNAIAGEVMAIQKMVDTRNKTWNEVKEDMDKVLNNLNIPEEARESIEEAFKASVYSGTSAGVYQAMQDLKRQQENDKSDSAWEDYYDNSGEISGWSKFWGRKKTQRKKWEAGIDSDYEKYWDMINGMDPKTLGAYNQIGVTSNKALTEYYNKNYGSEMKTAAMTGDSTDISMLGLSHLYEAQEDIKNQMSEMTDHTSDKYKELQDMSLAVEASIEEAWSNLPLSVEPTWEQLFKMYDDFTERTKTIRSTLAEIKEDGGIDYDQFKELTTLFDDVDTELLSGADLTSYGEQLTIIANNLSVVNGELQLNETALAAVGEMEADLAEAQIEGVRKKLIAKKTELEAQREMVLSDIAYMKTQLEIAKSVKKGTYDQEVAQGKLNTAKKKFNTNASKLLKTYVDNEYNAANAYQKNWTTAFNSVSDKYNKLLTARINKKNPGKFLREEMQKIAADLKPTTEGLYDFANMGANAAEEAINELNKQIKAAEETVGAYDLSIGNINLKLSMLDSGINKNTESFGKGSKAIKEYVSKLETFLNLLRHIEREEANLKFAKKLEGMQKGVVVLSRLGDELRYVTHLIGDMNTLYQNYEKEASSAASDIRKGFGDLVTFNKWGNYEVNMEAYNKMSDAEKKMLDESLDSYKKLVEARDKYYDSFLNYKEEELKINQKYIDKYIDGENTLVEAIKQREKAILDNKLAAIDKEIAAINKAAEARRKAREKEQQAEELSGMQVDLQRALMDSSGSSATDILDIQKQIKDKQQENADKSFDDMVNNMNKELENEKQLEQKLFNERLEEMDWYWDEVDRIMGEGTISVLDTMQTYMDKFNQGSELQQVELLKGWKNTFEQAVKIGKTGAQDYQKVVTDLQTEINKLIVDEDVLTDAAINTAFNKRPNIPKTSSGSKGGSGGSHNGYGGGHANGYEKHESNQDGDEQVKSEEPAKIPEYTGYFTRAKKGTVLEFKPGNGKIIEGRNSDGYYENFEDKWGSDQNFTYEGKYKYDPDWNFSGKTETGAYIALFSNKKGSYWFPITKNGLATGGGIWWDDGGLFHKGHYKYKNGGMNYSTGPAWLDGTATQPEAVLNAIETKAFLQFANDLTKIRQGQINTPNSNIIIDNISFNVESMSSVADGEKAFNAFVDKFKEIGSKQGISVLGTANRN